MRHALVLLCLLFAAFAGSLAHGQAVMPRYSEVRIGLADRSGLRALAGRVPGLDHISVEKTADGWSAVSVLGEHDLAGLAASGFAYEVTVPDLAAAYAARPLATDAERAAGLEASRVTGFDYGSMGGYYTFDEVLAKLDEMASDYPTLTTGRVSIGQSHEGRDVWMVKISDNPDMDEDEPEVLYTALHHAREPQSMATVLYTMFYLLENYGTDPEVTYLVDHRELYFVPVLNPDGYVYNEATNPNGGGFWRKNRRDNGGNVFGVDLNRNYAYEWGHDNSGSSPSASSETYRGPGPFSEPETAAIRDFLLDRDVKAALNYHAYGNLWIYPWGYESSFYTPDSALFVDIARDMTQINGYSYGTGDQTVGYLTNGDSDDWMYGEQETKGKIMSMTPEVGRGGDGFWPNQSRIIPIAEENREANLTLAWFAGAYPQVGAFEIAETHAAPNGYLDPGEPAALTLTLQNLGLEGLADARARVVSTNDALPVESGAFSAPFALGSQDTVEIEGLAFTLGLDAPLGLQDGLAVEIAFEGTTVVQPLGRISIGTPIAVFEDAAGSTAAWDTGSGWGLASANTSPPTSFADSPVGEYQDNASNALTLAEPLDLSDGVSPQLRFRARWDIEADYDFVQVRASTNGTNWTPLEGRFTRSGSGSGDQTEGEPGYDGTQTQWVQETMDLSAFAGEAEVYLQFRLQSDGSVTGDGFYLDDLAVETFMDGNTVANEAGAAPPQLALYENYPNPFSRSTLIPFDLPEAGPVTLTVYDLLGQRVRVLAEGERSAGAQSVSWDGRDSAGQRVASGIYVCSLRAGGNVVTRKLLVIR